jgi:hypothetical protein
MAAGYGYTQPMADDAASTRVRRYRMVVTQFVGIGNTLRCQHQKQQRKTRVATQPGESHVHNRKFIAGLTVLFNRIVGSITQKKAKVTARDLMLGLAWGHFSRAKSNSGVAIL